MGGREEEEMRGEEEGRKRERDEKSGEVGERTGGEIMGGREGGRKEKGGTRKRWK